ncbi:MAG: 3-phosphoshikimate 1-carboxyvinyltransferase [Gammaproteobacteria bacterium]|nr:3-phosphoshikimate 1-carboxyvinyltransferase [Gammaproteobacteria bacterium]
MSQNAQAFVVSPGNSLSGEVTVAGDKSISHRAIMFGAIALGVTRVRGFLPGEDCLATLSAMQSMGVRIERPADTEVVIHGVGMHGLQAPASAIDLGNSGTAMRLMMGLLAPQSFPVELVGDASLCSRPMERVAKPLRSMGASIETTGGKPPLRLAGKAGLTGIEYVSPIASAQVKSAILLAGLYAEGETAVVEPAITRDHTERMLAAFGVNIDVSGLRSAVQGGAELRAVDVDVPADISSATFPLAAACISATGPVVIHDVGINPSRTGILDILSLMGADIRLSGHRQIGGEPVARLTVVPAALKGVEIPRHLVPLAIDEFPVVFALAAVAQGSTVISGAEELRAKESDRIAAMVNGLRELGVAVEEFPDGARITGGAVQAGVVDSLGDHRIAMAFAVLAAVAEGPVKILNTANVATSFPGFIACMNSLGLCIEVADTAGSAR